MSHAETTGKQEEARHEVETGRNKVENCFKSVLNQFSPRIQCVALVFDLP